jgi:hypothetical protein
MARRRCATRQEATLYSPAATSNSASTAKADSSQAMKRGRSVSSAICASAV